MQCGGAGNIEEIHAVAHEAGAREPFAAHLAGWQGPWNFAAPAETEARLRAAGAAFVGRTNMSEFAFSGLGLNPHYGTPLNPAHATRLAGGSSSGAAVSVALGHVAAALGTDTGGSIRIPAAFCGLVGFKPTQGRIPHLPPSPVRSAGPITRTVADNALLLTALAEPDRRDYGSLPPDPTRYHERLDRDLKGVRIGLILEGDSGQPPEPAVAEAIERAAAQFAAAGAHVARLPSVVGADFMEIVGVLFLIRGYNEFSRLPQAAKRPVSIVEWQGRRDLNPQPLVLETSALPIELHP